METDDANRYRSRILREMNANRINPFNSPPSSTGSHGTVTMSSVFSDPDGESTRRLKEDIARITAPKKLPVNWEAVHRKWPEHFSKPTTNNVSGMNDAKSMRSTKSQHKDKRSSASNVKFTLDHSNQDIWQVSKKTRAEMQPCVDNDSDMSSILDKTPSRHASYVGTAKSRHQRSPLAREHHKATPGPASHEQRRPSITDALHRLQRASMSPEDKNQDSPNMSSAKSSMTAVAASPNSMASPGHHSSHLPSFFMPDVSHLGDFVTGTLKFSGSMKNGVPIFVKHGKVHDRQEKPNADAHVQVDGIKLPEDEEKIFVSMDMIRDEILFLQAAHDKVQQYAGDLQLQVERLEAQLRYGKVPSDNDGSEQIMAQKKHLELQVATLQARLDENVRKLSTNEIASESVVHERDRAITRLQEACEDISKLTRKLSVREKELSSSQKQLESSDQLRQENENLRRDLASLKHHRDALEADNSSLRSDNETLRKEQRRLRGEIKSLRSSNIQHNDDAIMAQHSALRSKIDKLTQENEDLHVNFEGVQRELDLARDEIESLHSKITVVQAEKAVLQNDNQHSALSSKIDKLTQENEDLHVNFEGVQRELDLARDEIESLHSKITVVQAEKESLRSKITVVQAEKAVLQNDNQSFNRRRVLDGLCVHNCRNCIVCSRITSHRGVVSPMEVAAGKKHVSVLRPVPVTDRRIIGDDPTLRPSQPPGHALALVIKGLQDEAEHLQLELTRRQAEYNGSDKAIGRRERLHLAESIRTLLKRMEVKNDQIYSLYDVLEGQKAAGQVMTEEEIEMTVLNITGMTVRDVTGGGCEHLTWEGITESVAA